MQNRKPAHQHDELTFAQFRALNKAHAEMHQVEEVLTLKEMLEGPSIETMVGKMMVEQALEKVHEELEVHAPEMAEQSERINADVAAKAKAVGAVLAEKNAVKETFAQQQGLFSSPIVRRRAEVEAMLNAAAEQSASNSEDEMEISPTLSPKM